MWDTLLKLLFSNTNIIGDTYAPEAALQWYQHYRWYTCSWSCSSVIPTLYCDTRLKTQDSKVFIWPFFTFSQITYNKQLHKLLIYKVKETSIKTTCGRWHGSHLFLQLPVYPLLRESIHAVIYCTVVGHHEEPLNGPPDLSFCAGICVVHGNSCLTWWCSTG